MVLVFVSLLALHGRARTRPGSAYGLVASAVSLGLMILTAGLIQQFYMVIYIAFINPDWVDMVMEIREGLLTSAGVAPEEIQQRLASTRRGFPPLAMLSTGLVVPALWTLAFALLLSVPISAGLARVPSPRVR